MNKRGFTTIELLVTISLLAMLTLFTAQAVMKFMSSSETKQQKSLYSLIENKTEEYVNDNRSSFPELGEEGASFYIELNTLKNEGYISDDLVDPTTSNTLDYSTKVKVTVEKIGKKENYEYGQ